MAEIDPSPACDARLRSIMSAPEVMTTLTPTGAYSLSILPTAGWLQSRVGRIGISPRPGNCRASIANAPTTSPIARLLTPNAPASVNAKKIIAALNNVEVSAG